MRPNPRENGASEGPVNVPHAKKPRVIRTTVGNDSSWLKDLIYTTWVDTPKASKPEIRPQRHLSKPIKGEQGMEKQDKKTLFKAFFSLFSHKKVS
ncbi:unnamed protein product [Phytomonas sp. Hart1]|nr:unnamed protein product [Phytomonas sp. Hart1]|eukprot:CCW66409.1 unnamed protein product [Phytomonas sp. isolate Hart1]